jgi:hypothetical protein
MSPTSLYRNSTSLLSALAGSPVLVQSSPRRVDLAQHSLPQPIFRRGCLLRPLRRLEQFCGRLARLGRRGCLEQGEELSHLCLALLARELLGVALAAALGRFVTLGVAVALGVAAIVVARGERRTPTRFGGRCDRLGRCRSKWRWSLPLLSSCAWWASPPTGRCSSTATTRDPDRHL